MPELKKTLHRDFVRVRRRPQFLPHFNHCTKQACDPRAFYLR